MRCNSFMAGAGWGGAKFGSRLSFGPIADQPGWDRVPFLFLHLAGMIAFVNIARYARNDPRGFFVTGATGYTAAAVIAAAWSLAVHGAISLELPAVLLGAYQGFAYQFMYLVVFVMVGLGGMAVTSTINRMTILVPTAGAILVWGEHPTPERYLGIVAIFLALPLLGLQAQRRAVQARMGSWLMPLMILFSFVLLGGAEFGAKWFVEARQSASPSDYTFWLFAAASVSSLFTWPLANRMARREWDRAAPLRLAPAPFRLQVNPRSIGFGIGLGAANWGQATALVNALTVFDASFVFPLVSASFVILVSVTDFVFWRQRFAPLTLLGLAVAAAGVVLINLDIGMGGFFS